MNIFQAIFNNSKVSSITVTHNGNTIISGDKTISDILTIENEKFEIPYGIELKIIINGNVGNVSTSNGNIKVEGNVTENVESTNGNITVHKGVDRNIKTTNGNVIVVSGDVKGNITTVNGDISIN